MLGSPRTSYRQDATALPQRMSCRQSDMPASALASPLKKLGLPRGIPAECILTGASYDGRASKPCMSVGLAIRPKQSGGFSCRRIMAFKAIRGGRILAYRLGSTQVLEP